AAVGGPDPGLGGQGIRDPGPALPLVVERDAGVDHGPPLWQEDVLDRPVEAPRRAKTEHVPASLDDLRFRTREDPPPVDRGAIGAPPRWVASEDLEAAQHPGALLAAGAEGPATGDPVAAMNRHGSATAHHGGARDDGVGPVRVDLVDAGVRQTERHEPAAGV